ncbi:MAG: hypothetical protein ACK5LJ_02975 [Paracoccus sp. (in: a-proteobacteria)]
MARPDITLTGEQAYTLLAFMESFDQRTTGAWRPVSEGMTEDFAIPDPEAALEDLRDALQS